MARTFNGTSDYLENSAAVLTAVPITMACWFKESDFAALRVLMSIGDASASTRLQIHTGATALMNAQTTDTANLSTVATGAVAISANAWHHACGVFVSAAERRCFLDGTDKGTDLTTRVLGTPTVTTIGARYTAGARGAFLAGQIAEAGVWDVALDDADVARLALGYSPLLIRREHLKAYWPLIGRYSPEIDLVGRFDATVTGAVVADHTRMIYPARRRFSSTFNIAAAGLGFDATSNSGYQTAQSAYSWNHTCAGSNRYLVVGIAMLSVAGSSVSGITYNGVAMTFLGARASAAGAVRVEQWGLAAPATGTNAIAVTLSAALDSSAGAASFINVHQGLPTEGFNSATATNVGAADATVDVTTLTDGDWVIDLAASSDTSITVGPGQTSRWNVTGTLGSGAGSTEGAKSPSGVVTMSWTNVAAAATWSIAAVALRPVGSWDLGLRVGQNPAAVLQ